jgi:UDP-GlcNAc3NAcA epimerase
VYLVGDVMYDAVLLYLDLAEKKSEIMERLGLKPKSYALVTVHRAENTDQPERLKAFFEGLESVAKEGLPVVLPLHPRTRKQLNTLGIHPKEVQVLDPVSYLDMLVLEKNARVILTDSGGVQKEAFFFRVPCVTLREETEWVETVETGWNTLVGCDPEKIVQAALEARKGQKIAQPYGDSWAAERIVSILERELCGGQ